MDSLSSFNIAACIILLLQAIHVINHMNCKTNHVIRVAYTLVAVGALGVIITPISQDDFTKQVGALVNIGIAILLGIDYYNRQCKKEQNESK